MVGGRRASTHGPSRNSLRAWWSHRPWLVGVLGLWLVLVGLLLLQSKHSGLSSTRVSWHPNKHPPRPAWTSSHATCDAAAQPSPDEVQRRFAQTWGHSCVPFRQACYDQGTFVVFDKAHLPQHGGRPPLKALKLGSNHLSFRDFGDGIGIMQYPEIIFRPANSQEESPDLRSPVAFSNCARPVVLYLDHIFMLGDFFVRTIGPLVNALHSPNGAWDTDYSIVVATGGQKLQAWQKLMLQPFSRHPIMTLSAASSRALAFLPAEELAHYYYEQDGGPHNKASGAGRRLQQSTGLPGSRQHANHSGGSSSDMGSWQHATVTQQWLLQQQQQQDGRQQRQLQQQKLQHHKLTVLPPITVYGRCFESLTVCKVQGLRGFPDSVARPIWSGAQHVKQFWEQQYGESYRQLLPQHQAMQQAGGLRIVFAVRATKPAVRSILNQQDLLEWCNSWKPHSPDGRPSPKYARTVCIAHVFGQHGKVHTQPRQPAAAAVAGLGGAPGTAAAALPAPVGPDAAQQAGSAPISSSSSRTPDDGLFGRLHDSLLGVAGTIMGFISGHSGRTRVLLSSSTADTAATSTAAAAAASSAATDSQQKQQHSSAVENTPARALKQLQQQQQQQQQLQTVNAAVEAGGAAHADHPPDLPADPELDPRALLADLALLDETDVVVGLHGAQLYNALYMPAHKALVEVRPYQFAGGWPETYFKGPLTSDDKSDGIFWFGIDTVNASNSKPGQWEVEATGCCYPRDRHTRIELAALEYIFRRIVWAAEDPQRYKQLAKMGETHITDALQPAEEYHKQHDPAKLQQQQQQVLLQGNVAAAAAGGLQQQQQQQKQNQKAQHPNLAVKLEQQQQPMQAEPQQKQQPSPPLPTLLLSPQLLASPPPPSQQQEVEGMQDSPQTQLDPQIAELEQDQAAQQDEQELEAMETAQLAESSNSTL